MLFSVSALLQLCDCAGGGMGKVSRLVLASVGSRTCGKYGAFYLWVASFISALLGCGLGWG